MTVNKISNLRIDVLNTINEIENRLEMLGRDEPIFGFVSSKYIKCGKQNCKCEQGKQYLHGPYYYLRMEPEYRYSKYLGKRIPTNIEGRIDVGNRIKDLIRKKKKLLETLEKLENI
ncbi:MAG: hypothetical protein KGD64_07055 [Candidatus Heimdallarchaeota archaeon]|nr:hypothetical protein [Candidatus Heimdallarchaeota archaeon]